MTGRITGGQRSGQTRREQANERALEAWLLKVKAARTDYEVCRLLAGAVQSGIRIGYERAYNRFARLR